MKYRGKGKQRRDPKKAIHPPPESRRVIGRLLQESGKKEACNEFQSLEVEERRINRSGNCTDPRCIYGRLQPGESYAAGALVYDLQAHPELRKVAVLEEEREE